MVSGGWKESPSILHFEQGRGGRHETEGGGSRKTPPSRVSREGGLVVARRRVVVGHEMEGGGSRKTPPSHVLSEGGVVVARWSLRVVVGHETEGGGSRKPLQLAFRAREGWLLQNGGWW